MKKTILSRVILLLGLLGLPAVSFAGGEPCYNLKNYFYNLLGENYVVKVKKIEYLKGTGSQNKNSSHLKYGEVLHGIIFPIKKANDDVTAKFNFTVSKLGADGQVLEQEDSSITLIGTYVLGWRLSCHLTAVASTPEVFAKLINIEIMNNDAYKAGEFHVSFGG